MIFDPIEDAKMIIALENEHIKVADIKKTSPSCYNVYISDFKEYDVASLEDFSGENPS